MVNTTLQVILVLFVCFLSPAFCAEQLTIAVASNFNLAMRQLSVEYEKTHDTKLRLSLGSSGKLYAQIVNGAPYDIFLSADQSKPQALIEQNLAAFSSRFTYAYGSLVLWSALPNLIDGSDKILHTPKFNKLALANPKLAPYGQAALDTLKNLGLIESTENRWVQGENISQTYQFVATQNADVGFVALSQIMYQGNLASGSAWLVPKSLYHAIKQDAVILNRSQNKKTAADFMAFMQSPQALAIMADFGYQQHSAEQ